jgi:hypothetical protein
MMSGYRRDGRDRPVPGGATEDELDLQAETLCRVLGAKSVAEAARIARENRWVLHIPALRDIDIDAVERHRGFYVADWRVAAEIFRGAYEDRN